MKKQKKGNVIDYKIVQGVYLLGSGQEQNQYEFKIFKGHPDFNKIHEDSVCWTFYQTPDVITPIPALIRVTKIYSDQNAVRLNNQLEYRNGYPLILIAKVVDDFDFRLLEYIYAANHRYESEIGRLNTDMEHNVIVPPNELGEKYKLYKEIHQLHKEGVGVKTIASQKSISKNTVKKYLKMSNADFIKSVHQKSVKQYRDYILNCLYKNPKASAKKIYDQLKKDKKIELDITERHFRRYVNFLRNEHKIKKK